MRAVKLMCMTAALLAFVAPRAHADEWNKLTYLTFSGPVQIPGATLQAGTYTFEVADPDTTRHVIRVSEKDTNKPVGLFMTIPMERSQAPDNNLVLFAERPAGQAQAIQAWFYPGDRTGEEFVYPKSEAMKIAKANRKPVLATAANSNASASESQRIDDMRKARVGRVDESGNVTNDQRPTRAQSESMPSQSAQPSRSAAPTTTAQSDDQSRSSTANSQTTGTTGRRELPRTASDLTAIELIGALSLIAGFVTSRLRRIAETRQ